MHKILFTSNHIKHNFVTLVNFSQVFTETNNLIMDFELSSSPTNGSNHSGQKLSTPSSSALLGGSFRNNEVRSVMLYGVPIIALVMDAQERLCLAQISNTLLKRFSYNEIHNRRVALGITCVQCTPVQLELLRRAGAMPVSSRRCGMITKREAERLCKSFLAETAPPKLPDTFAFDVCHHCAWGSRGSFTPSRYNSSRAKCIKCVYCGLFFSPNKFIFHSHRLPDSKYTQPDAANFNSWRRHIKLFGNPPDDVLFAWEDVKAMFNGGSRKRAMAASLTSVSRNINSRNMSESHHDFTKRQRISISPETPQSLTPSTTVSDSVSPKNTNGGAPYFPLIPFASKCYSSLPSPVNSFVPSPSLQSPTAKQFAHNNASDFRQSFAEFMWVGAGKAPSLQLPYSCLLWPRPPTSLTDSNRPKLSFDMSETNPMIMSRQREHWQCDLHDTFSNPIIDKVDSNTHTSAFKPVTKASTGKASPNTKQHSMVPKDPNNTLSRSLTTSHSSTSPDLSEDNDPDIDIIGDEENDDESDELFMESVKLNTKKSKGSSTLDSDHIDQCYGGRDHSKMETSMMKHDLNYGTQNKDKFERQKTNEESHSSSSSSSNITSSALDLRNIVSLSKNEIHNILEEHEEARKKCERDYEIMKETLEEQIRKEIAYREEVSKQLQLVRDALCQELGNEKKARLTVEHRLKETQETLHNVTYKLLTNQQQCMDYELRSLSD